MNPPSFIRPERVAFSCVRTDKSGEKVPVPIEQCSPCKGHGTAHALYAFVTQTTRGELAAVDLKARQVIDTRTTVPGFTFVPVGESPSAIVVPALDPKFTYVASVGSSDLRVLDTQSLLSAGVTTAPTLAVIPLGRMVGAQWQDAEPIDMVLSVNEQRLLIAAPRLHGVLVIEVADIERVVRNEITPAALPQTLVALSGLSSSATVAIATGSDRYAIACGVNPSEPSQVLPPRDVSATTSDAYPIALTVDAQTQRVLVADAALPIIHAIDLATLTEVRDGDRPLYVTGVPTLDVVLSPPVPASPGDAVMERYIYAIDAEQRDVLVMNDRGVLQSVNAAGHPRADRLDLGGAAALSLEVLEPGYRGCVASSGQVGSRSLRGVFVAASLVDGTIRFVDVHDMDAQRRCTPTTTSETPVACTTDAPCAAFHRHRPRIGTSFTSATPCIRPTLRDVKNTSLTLRAGANDQATVPNLMPLDGCAAGKTVAYQEVASVGEGEPPTLECPSAGANRAPLVCITSDLWSMGNETWFATWEGVIPGSETSGSLNVDARTLTTDAVDFCALGVEAGTVASRFAIELAIVPTDAALIAEYDRAKGVDLSDVDCALFNETQADGTRARLALEITDATPNALTLGALVDTPEAFAEDSDADVLAKALHCVAGQRVTFGIRSLNRYTVIGGRSGFRHRVENVSGTCVGPAETDVLSDGQAVAGTRFENANLAFQIRALPADVEPVQDLTFGFALAESPGFVGLATGVSTSFQSVYTVVPELRYSPTDFRLYAVDSAARGLMPVGLSPLPSGLSSGSVFQ